MRPYLFFRAANSARSWSASRRIASVAASEALRYPFSGKALTRRVRVWNRSRGTLSLLYAVGDTGAWAAIGEDKGAGAYEPVVPHSRGNLYQSARHMEHIGSMMA